MDPLTGDDVVDLRVIKLGERVYVRVEDVATYIQQLCSTEETDVRERLLKASHTFLALVERP